MISLMVKRTQLHGDAPYVQLDKQLFTLLQENFDGSVANVAALILSGGKNQVARMAYAFGPEPLKKFFFYLKSLVEQGKQYNGLEKLYEIAKEAYTFTSGGSETDEKLEVKPATPKTYDELMRIPMHPDVKDIKAHYRSLIEKKAAR